jgi:hypothetical protein
VYTRAQVTGGETAGATTGAGGGARRFGWLLAAGLLARLLGLGLPGTFDVEIQKAWAARAASSGLADIYGPSDAEIGRLARDAGRGTLDYALRERLPVTYFQWQGETEFFVDYPPGSLLVLWAAGWLWRLIDPALGNGTGFTVIVNLAPLLGGLAITWLLYASSPEHGRTRALAFWLNPAVILAAPVLGYQDTVFGALALGAVLLLLEGRRPAATALVVAAGLVKPQGVLLVPVLLVTLAREAKPRVWLACAATGAAAAAAILAPWWSNGHLLSALDGCRRPLGQPTLAPLGLNLWWIAGWAMDWTREGPWPLARIVPLAAFERWAGFDARNVARPLVLLASTAVALWLLRAPRGDDRRALPFALVLQVHAYALLATSVHENHTFLAVIVAPLLLGAAPHAARVHAALSAFLFANLFLMDGLGRKILRLRELRELRGLTGIDLSVLVAATHVALVAWLALLAWRVSRERAAPG